LVVPRVPYILVYRLLAVFGKRSVKTPG
jgi:hypothetical protein